MKNILLIVAALLASYTFYYEQNRTPFNETKIANSVQDIAQSNDAISNAFANHKSDIQVSGQGVVTKVLPDDNNGSRHQKFIIKLPSGLSLLVAHNIDLAPKITTLAKGDAIKFYGEYEWNEKGGVIHWTHGDPRGAHIAGWLQHQGKKYQ